VNGKIRLRPAASLTQAANATAEPNAHLGTIQIHREDTSDTPEEFQHRFPVGMWLDIVTTTEITPESNTDEFADSGAPMDHTRVRLQ
jgi:hypothetical protein